MYKFECKIYILKFYPMKNILISYAKGSSFLVFLVFGISCFAQQKSPLNRHELNAGISARMYNITDQPELEPDMIVLHADYKYALSRRFVVGGTAGIYHHFNEQYNNGIVGGCYGDYYSKWDLHKDYAFLLASVQYNWISSRMIKLYSSVEGGLKYRNTVTTEVGFYSEDYARNFYNKTDRNNIATSGQVNLIGIRVGNKLGGFAEIGFGDKGYATCGISYRF